MDNAMELEKYLVSLSDSNLLDIPLEGMKTYREGVEEGASMAVGKHPEKGWFVLCTMGQGPIICWREWADE